MYHVSDAYTLCFSSLYTQVSSPLVQAITTLLLLTCKTCGAVLVGGLQQPHNHLWLTWSCLCTLLAASVQGGRHLLFGLQVCVVCVSVRMF